MSQRDSGWLQPYTETNQEVADPHVQASYIAGEPPLPMMVCVDGFIFTHAMEIVDMPEVEDAARFLPPYEPRQVLDPASPVLIGAMVGSEAHTEARHLAHHRQIQALELIPKIQKEFTEVFGQDSNGLVRPYRIEDADTIIVSMGSIPGTIKDVVDERRERRGKIGALGVTSFHPFPTEVMRDALRDCRHFINIEKTFSIGIDGIVLPYRRGAVRDMRIENSEVFASFGGYPITKAFLHGLLDTSAQNTFEAQTSLDLDHELIDARLAHETASRLSSPPAESVACNSYARPDAALARETRS